MPMLGLTNPENPITISGFMFSLIYLINFIFSKSAEDREEVDGDRENLLDTELLPAEEFPEGFPISMRNLDTDPFLRIQREEADTWAASVPDGVASALKQHEAKRQEHIYEFIITEKHHCQLLKVIQKVFCEGMTTYLDMKPELLDRLFPQLDTLINLHFEFLRQLRERQVQEVEKNIINKESPDWLKKRIMSLGLKPISAIVDATNYVMFDLNRPLHAYDADKIDQEIIVRNSKKGESFTALDDKKYTLQKDMCVIADRSGVLGLGGVIGGTRSGTEIQTQNILLESAYFLPSSIRKTSKQLGLETDAKYRFERGIDPNSIIDGLKIATDLILKICGGEASKFNIAGKKEYKSKPIELELGKFKKIIGFDITVSETKKILNYLKHYFPYCSHVKNIFLSFSPTIKLK